MNVIADLVNDIVKEHYAYLSECEHNITETSKSIAVLKAKTKELQAYTELADQYFQYQMQERDRLYRSAMEVLDKAIELGNEDMAAIALMTIALVHKKSPFSFRVDQEIKE
jgi:hypothetical protein